jgi:ubiquinone/menaquinone biosynthesis C-methylase UbiE/uncharacterized protein YbaR (Trm112 family)
MLQCVKSGAPLKMEHRPDHEWTGLRFRPSEYLLKSDACDAVYPITEDGIPVIWTDQLRDILNNDTDDISPLSANMDVYDAVSDDYMNHWRMDDKNALRLQTATKRLLKDRVEKDTQDKPLLHLDFGCGPGHVLNWLSKFGFQSVGLDVSLSNLRNTRDKTGAFVVLASASEMPFRSEVFDLVTESSVLHHIEDWRSVLKEAMRITHQDGGIVIDTEPSHAAKDWSKVAVLLFESRWYPYKLMSYFMKSKFWFRDLKVAKLTFEQAEIHNRAGTGFKLEEIKALFDEAGFSSDIVSCPDENLEPKAGLTLQEKVLHTLSFHNPLNPKYGWFTLLAHK